jgi:hypothetical protein
MYRKRILKRRLNQRYYQYYRKQLQQVLNNRTLPFKDWLNKQQDLIQRMCRF